jgi:hypothetical protein
MSVIVKRSRLPRLETQLLSPVRRWLESEGYITVDEFQTPWGITDLLGLKYNLDMVFDRIANKQLAPIGDLQSVMVFLLMPPASSRHSLTEEELFKELGYLMGEPKLRAIVASLRRKKLITISSSGRFTRAAPWLPYHERMVSVELKLSRVDEAIAQAKRHRVITPFSYVALPESVAEKAAVDSRSTDFIVAGVGLISVAKDTCRVLLEPREKSSSLEQAYEIAAAEQLWSRVLKTVDH